MQLLDLIKLKIENMKFYKFLLKILFFCIIFNCTNSNKIHNVNNITIKELPQYKKKNLYHKNIPTIYSKCYNFFSKIYSNVSNLCNTITPQKSLLKSLLTLVYMISSSNADCEYTFILEWGDFGTGESEFNFPQGVAADNNGNIFVADTFNHRVQKFNNTGGFIDQWGDFGIEEGEFKSISALVADNNGNVFVADTTNDRIQKFNNTGGFITAWGQKGSEPGNFSDPQGITLDNSGNVFVADSLNERIQKFSNTGTLITYWGELGDEEGNFSFPFGISTDSNGNVYVADVNNNRLQKFSNNGNFILSWSSNFNKIAGVATDNSNDVFTTESIFNNRVQKFTNTGSFITKFGSFGSSQGLFFDPCGITVDNLGDVYIADSGNNRIQKFRCIGPTADPTTDPTFDPTFDPTADPTFDPTAPTDNPTDNPTKEPTIPTLSPTESPFKLGETFAPSKLDISTSSIDLSETSFKHKDEGDNLLEIILPVAITSACIICCCCLIILFCICATIINKKGEEKTNVAFPHNSDKYKEVEGSITVEADESITEEADESITQEED